MKIGMDSWMKSNEEIDIVASVAANTLERINPAEIAIINTRIKSQFLSEHIKGAENTPLNGVNDQLAQFPKEAPFYVHCPGSYRSMIASSIQES